MIGYAEPFNLISYKYIIATSYEMAINEFGSRKNKSDSDDNSSSCNNNNIMVS